MSEDNVFNENVDYLLEAQKVIKGLDTLKAKAEELNNKDKRLKKSIANEEKSIADEIASTLKKRKAEITDSYDEQIDANRNKIKNIKNKRDKEKSLKVGERVELETADIKEENRQLKVEMKTLFKKNRVPGFCNNGFYYSLFMPKGFGEVVTLILSILVGVAGLPALVLFLLKTFAFKEKTLPEILSIVIVAGIIVVIFALYFLLFNVTKLRHRDILADGRQIRDKVKANNKNIKAIKNAINKDKDESGYGLDSYDSKLSQLEAEGEGISKDKQDALTVFENSTKNVIIQEINGRRLGKLENMKSDALTNEQDITALESQISDMTLAITNQYEAFLGKEFCKSEKLDDLIALMEDGSASTVSEAMAAYKGKNNN